MKFALVKEQISGGSRDGFAVRRNDQDPWVTLSSLGLEPRDTAELIDVSAETAERLSAGQGSPLVGEKPLQCPVVRPGKIVAIGLNYMDHIRETGSQVPQAPLSFAKYPSSLAGPSDDIVVDPALTSEGDYEGELAVVIGRKARSVAEDDSLNHVFGYAVANDVSARDLQRIGPTFSRSKSFDGFCPIGPWLTTADEVAKPQSLAIVTRVNGDVRQDSSTAEMIFSIGYLISFLSQTMTLWPGDVVLTGTPHGVGLGRKPPTFLAPGDVIEIEIESLGTIRNRVVGPTPR